MRSICSILSLFFITNLSLAQNNSFNGIFSNAEIGLTITLEGQNVDYSGQFALQGQTFPITAQLQDHNFILGTYPYLGSQVPIQLMEIAGNYVLITEGVTVPMTFSPSTKATNKPISTTSPIEKETNTKPTSTVANTGKKATGQSFSDPYSGYQFNIPTDWVGQQQADGSYLIGHNIKAGFILIMPHQLASLELMRQEAAQGVVEEGIQLFPTTQINNYGKNGLIADFSGTIQGQEVKVHSIGLLSPNGGGLTMMIAVGADLHTAEYQKIIESVANSVIFSTPKTSPVGNEWKQRLNGKTLKYYNTSNGFSDKTVIGLCETGYFGFSSNSSGMSTGLTTLTYASQDGGQGTWKIIARGQEAVLILAFTSGEIYEYTLANRGDSGGQINLNGKRYFVVNESGCF